MSLATPFESGRLRFRMLIEEDLEAVYRQFSDPDMCRYFSEAPVTREQAREIIRMFQDPDVDGYLRYGLFHNQTGDFVGTCGFHHWDREKRQAELGYDIWKGYWGQGYATEAVQPLVEICFQRLSVDVVYVLIHPQNVASIRTAEKFNFVESKPCRPLDEESQVCMKLTSAEWSARGRRSLTIQTDGEARNGV